MSSRTELLLSEHAVLGERQIVRDRLVRYVGVSWGLCAFFPIGLMYLHALLMLVALAISSDVAQRLRTLRGSELSMPLLLILAWTLIATFAGEWHPDTPTRLFHIARVAVVLSMGLMLSAPEARAALCGFVVAAVLAAFIVAVHHVWELPKSAIWNSLLVSRNNFSSGNMITMAVASGVCLVFGMGKQAVAADRRIFFAAALALSLTVALHAVSRNSQLLLLMLFLTSLVYRFRSTIAVLGGIALAFALAAMAWQFSPTTKERFSHITKSLELVSTESNYSNSVGVRWRMYQEAVQGMWDHPVFGTGVGSWLPHWRMVWSGLNQRLSPEMQSVFAEINNPHNDFLLAGMETGVIGMLLLVWLLARFIKAGWNQGSTAGGVTVVMGVAMSVTALVNAPFRDAALGMTLVWLLAVSVAAHGKAGRA